MASLELNKIYKTHPDDNAAELGLVRIVDESGEDYLYPREYFAILPKDAFCSMHFSQDERSKILHSLMPAWPGTYAVSVAWASRPCVTGASCPCFFYFFANLWLPRKQPRCSHATQVFLSFPRHVATFEVAARMGLGKSARPCAR